MVWPSLMTNNNPGPLSLNFRPRNPCFSKAGIEWRGVVLNGKTAPNKALVDLSDEDLSELIHELFGKLEFIEVAELFQAIEESPLASATFQ